MGVDKLQRPPTNDTVEKSCQMHARTCAPSRRRIPGGHTARGAGSLDLRSRVAGWRANRNRRLPAGRLPVYPWHRPRMGTAMLSGHHGACCPCAARLLAGDYPSCTDSGVRDHGAANLAARAHSNPGDLAPALSRAGSRQPITSSIPMATNTGTAKAIITNLKTSSHSCMACTPPHASGTL